MGPRMLNRILHGNLLKLFIDGLDDNQMEGAGLDDMMETDLANMAERDAEVEMVMAEFDAGDAGGGIDVND